MKPFVSVCVPTFNGAKYLRVCLDSILSQSFKNFELVIVDDSSRDGTNAIISDYASRDGRIKAFHNPRTLGMVANWNRCAELAQGEWIKFVFQDDFIEPRCLECFCDDAKRTTPIVVCRRNVMFDGVSSDVRQWYEQYLDDFSFERLFPGKTRISATEFSDVAVHQLGCNFVGEPTAVLLHRDVFQDFGNFNANLIQLCDFEYWARIASQTGMVYVPERLATFRVHSGSASAHNAAQKAFRAGVLDEVILLHEFIHRPEYAALRKAARATGTNLPRKLARTVNWMERSVGRDHADNGATGQMAQADWNALLSRYPSLRTSWYFKYERAKNLLDRYLLWRF